MVQDLWLTNSQLTAARVSESLLPLPSVGVGLAGLHAHLPSSVLSGSPATTAGMVCTVQAAGSAVPSPQAFIQGAVVPGVSTLGHARLRAHPKGGHRGAALPQPLIEDELLHPGSTKPWVPATMRRGEVTAQWPTI